MKKIIYNLIPIISSLTVVLIEGFHNHNYSAAWGWGMCTLLFIVLWGKDYNTSLKDEVIKLQNECIGMLEKTSKNWKEAYEAMKSILEQLDQVEDKKNNKSGNGPLDNAQKFHDN